MVQLLGESAFRDHHTKTRFESSNMANSPFTLYIDVASSSSSRESTQLPLIPTAPERALPRTYHSVPQAPPDPIELGSLQLGVKLTGPVETGAGNPSGGEGPSAPNDLEMSRPTTPMQDNEVFEAMLSFTNPPMNRFRMMAFCTMNFLSGLNDSAPGALFLILNRMSRNSALNEGELLTCRRHYGIGYAVVSLIFVTNAVGFVSAAFIVEALRARIGHSWTLILSNSFLVCGYIPVICTPPFPVVVCCFFLLGVGIAINLTLGNIFTGKSPK